MKVSLTFKTPGVVDQLVQELLTDRINASPAEVYDEHDRKELAGYAAEKVEGLKKWIRNNEYVTIEFDLDAGTATVKEL